MDKSGYTVVIPEHIKKKIEEAPPEVQEEIESKTSLLYQLLQKGRDMADYVIDLKLFEMAKSGDIKALEKLDYRKRTI